MGLELGHASVCFTCFIAPNAHMILIVHYLCNPAMEQDNIIIITSVKATRERKIPDKKEKFGRTTKGKNSKGLVCGEQRHRH